MLAPPRAAQQVAPPAAGALGASLKWLSQVPSRQGSLLTIVSCILFSLSCNSQHQLSTTRNSSRAAQPPCSTAHSKRAKEGKRQLRASRHQPTSLTLQSKIILLSLPSNLFQQGVLSLSGAQAAGKAGTLQACPAWLGAAGESAPRPHPDSSPADVQKMS